MVDYEYYSSEFKGTVSEAIFNELEPKVCDIISIYIMSIIPSDRVKDTLDDYEIDLKKDICYQIDYINEQGKDILNGSQAKNRLKSVKNAAFTYEYDLSETDNVESVNGIPISPFASIHIRTELNKQGYFNRLVEQCHHHVF